MACFVERATWHRPGMKRRVIQFFPHLCRATRSAEYDNIPTRPTSRVNPLTWHSETLACGALLDVKRHVDHRNSAKTRQFWSSTKCISHKLC